MYTSQPQACSDVIVVKSILIVEDDPILGNLLLEVLQEEAIYQGHLAPSGEMALIMLQTITPDLFLLDYHLPGMNGLELADQLQRREGGEHTPILLMSADLPQENGALDHLRTLQKPFDLETLLQLIAHLLA
ncbi:response regulator [Ktedonobacter robiniae]|uniref:Response regulatory domain-containing protein n=1 Tax=Ktedonobacter robiniae TaxID=2778365 RepID=A0ABQ3V775_9CHLR|nr:response regulator [Ktedonobacter robiniae]GHO60698.1 hypothetical protein KSB_91730 [Ktedonobacter robiniae]GHO60744.1 hypothetical protein KSB_92190 [Ktedonobacter robiniae]